MGLSREKLTISNTALGLTVAAFPTGVTNPAVAIIQVQDQPIRFTLNGTTPVATTTGQRLEAGDRIVIRGDEAIRGFKAIRDGGTDASIEVIYGTMDVLAVLAAGPQIGSLTVNTELPAAAALDDATANPTTPLLGAAGLVFDGTTWRRGRAPIVFKDVSTVAIGTIATVWAPAAGKKFRLLGGMLSVSAAVNVLLEDNAAGAGNFVLRTPKLLADTPFTFDLGPHGKLSAAADQVLKATGSGAANLIGTLWGTEE